MLLGGCLNFFLREADGGIAILLREHPGFWQGGDGRMVMLFQGRAGFLKEGELTTGEGGGFLRGGKKQSSGLSCSHCELEEDVLRSLSSR